MNLANILQIIPTLFPHFSALEVYVGVLQHNLQLYPIQYRYSPSARNTDCD